MMKERDIEAAVDRLREAGCGVAALRVRSVPSDGGEILLMTAKDCGVARIVSPLGRHARDLARRAGSVGIRASFSNGALGGIGVSERLLSIASEGIDAGLTFQASGFAAAGEWPFLGTYKRKLKTFVDQLDLEDGCYDGMPAALGQGHAEIKEMISSLSAAGFAGHMVLGPANRATGSLGDAVGRFVRMLDACGQAC
jgi:hypothetical protein